MITINVRLQVKPEKRAAYIAFVAELVQASLKDEGCLFYDHFESLTEPNQFAIVENWASQEAVAKHNETDHLKKFAAEISEFLEKDFVLQVSHA